MAKKYPVLLNLLLNLYKVKITAMNAAEIKLDLFRRIDGLEINKLEKVYAKILNLLGPEQNENPLSPDLKKALDDALTSSMNGHTYSHDDVIKLTKEKYPKLF
jgi:hypothetical protein